MKFDVHDHIEEDGDFDQLILSVRDKYVDELSTYYATGVGKLETFEVNIRVNIQCILYI